MHRMPRQGTKKDTLSLFGYGLSVSFLFIIYFSEKSEIGENLFDSFITGAESSTHLEN